ncbi:glutamate receptor 1-like [Palaemon carinicauda]|uniref:glutamate receptor 1-like n=1 Tax=Palaemon carinicauda TaxID=392227 RepID=UPI0035B58A23
MITRREVDLSPVLKSFRQSAENSPRPSVPVRAAVPGSSFQAVRGSSSNLDILLPVAVVILPDPKEALQHLQTRVRKTKELGMHIPRIWNGNTYSKLASVNPAYAKITELNPYGNVDGKSQVVLANTDRGFSPLSSTCLASSGILQKLWALGMQLEFLHFDIGQKDVALDLDSNVVGVYSNATRFLLSWANEKEGLLKSAWIMITPPEGKEELMSRVTGFDCFLDSTILVALYSECQAKIESPYRVGPRGGLIVENLGSWDPSKGYFSPYSGINKYDRRWDYKGYPVRGIGVNIFKHFLEYLDNGEISGYFGSLVTLLRDTHNFTLTYRTLAGYAYGTVIDAKLNKWNGLVGELQNKRADVTICELAYLKERVQVVDYTQPVAIASYNMFASSPEDLKQKVLAYVLPMETNLYLSILFTAVIAVVTMVLFERLYNYFLPNQMEEEPMDLGLAFLYIASTFFQQGCLTKPTMTPTRIVFLFCLFLALVVYTSYSAKLTSQLAVEKPTPLPFSNLNELSYQTDWNAGNNEKDFFQVTSSQVCANATTEYCRILYRLWTNIISKRPENLATNYTNGLMKVLKGRYVFIGVDVSTQYFLSQMPTKDACRIKMLPGRYLPIGLGLGLQFNSPFRGSFDHTIQKLREDGVLNRLSGRFLRQNPKCNKDTVVVTEAEDVTTLFIVLLSGAGLSITILLCEIWAYRLSNQRLSAVEKF